MSAVALNATPAAPTQGFDDAVCALIGKQRGAPHPWLSTLLERGLDMVMRTTAEQARASLALLQAPDGPRVKMLTHEDVTLLVGGKPGLDGNASVPLPLDAMLALWRRDGVGMLSRLRGHFWLAILRPATGESLLAIDRHAVENLFYVANGDELAFSTRLDPLADHPLVGRRVTSQALFDYLYFHCVPGPETIHPGARRLLPGHYLHQRDGQIRVAAWWRPASSSAPATARARAEDLPAALEGAVQQRLPEGPIGCFLSGGLDSSTVAGLAARHRPGEVTAFTIGFDAAGYDEMDYARTVARHFKVPHAHYYVTPQDIIDSLPRIVGGLDGPFGNASAIPTYFCARLAAEHGVPTLLAGDGGDEIFGGNTRYMTQLKFELYSHLPVGLRERVIEPAMQALPAWTRRSVIAKAASYVRQAATPLPARLMTYNLLERIPHDTLLNPDFMARIDHRRPLTRLGEMYPDAPDLATVDRLLQLDWRLTLADSDLPKVKRMTALAGVNVAFPMLDEAVVDYAAALSPSDKVTLHRMRPIYRKAFADFLPAQTLRKGKQGFGLPFGPWLSTHSGLQEFVEAPLLHLEQAGILAPGFRARFMATGLRDHPGYYGVMVYILVALGLWMQQARATLVT
jgi:asparagine synthase (glutamine-hydrolysing)